MAAPVPSLGAVGRTPGLWSVGLLGFLARGGLLLILLPMLAVPSPVSLSVLIGPDLVDANGLSARVATLIVLALGLLALALTAGLVVAALADIAAFQGILRAAGVPAGPFARRQTARLVAQLLALQVLAAVPLLVALVPTVGAMAAAVRQEVLLPSDQSLPLWWRVVEVTWPWLLVVGGAILLATHIYSVVGRELLARRAGLRSSATTPTIAGRLLWPLGALFRRPLRRLVASLVAWVMGIFGATVAAALVALGWAVAQAVYLSSPAAGATTLATASTVLVVATGTVVLVSLLGAALVLLGVLAAVRSALLTRAALGGRGMA